MTTTSSNTHPSTMLAESLALFSRAAHQAFAEVEAQSRAEIARAIAETREMREERDDALNVLHNGRLEMQTLKQETASNKANLAQAELTISHQAETIATQIETIAQLRRELIQWKDQSRNWQEHFLRVEQERCAQSSRIDELLLEKIQYAQLSANPASLFTPPKPKHNNTISSAPSSLNPKRTQIPSPTSAANSQAEGEDSPTQNPSSVKASSKHAKANNSTSKSKPGASRNKDIPSPRRKNQATVSSGNPRLRELQQDEREHQIQAGPSQNHQVVSVTPIVIRRVCAVVNVKREYDSGDEAEGDMLEHIPPQNTSLPPKQDHKEESLDALAVLNGHSKPRRNMRQRKAIDYRLSEDEKEGDDDDDEPIRSASRGRYRSRNMVNYAEDEDNDEEDDELMMGAEDNHEEVYGLQRVNRRDEAAAPPQKKRKLAQR